MFLLLLFFFPCISCVRFLYLCVFTMDLESEIKNKQTNFAVRCGIVAHPFLICRLRPADCCCVVICSNSYWGGHCLVFVRCPKLQENHGGICATKHWRDAPRAGTDGKSWFIHGNGDKVLLGVRKPIIAQLHVSGTTGSTICTAVYSWPVSRYQVVSPSDFFNTVDCPSRLVQFPVLPYPQCHRT